MTPFLRWAGGKRWLANKLSPVLHKILKENGGIYYEPFLGAGAMFFELAPQKSILSDLNSNLIETYEAIRLDWFQVQQNMKQWSVNRETYYKVRSLQPNESFERAARFIWLNRTCYGGLYRENKSGQFNVPYGGGSRTPEILYKKNLLEKAGDLLKKNVTILDSDFELVIEQANTGDVVYCDPTYSNVKRGQFDRYGANIFSWSDQVRLARSAERAWSRGVTVVISNGHFDDLIPLYPKAYRIPQNKNKAIGNKSLNNNNGRECLMILDPSISRKKWQPLGQIENQRIGKKSLNIGTTCIRGRSF